ncbi:MAG: hypothetical protein V4649_17210 [Bacteroidota bacterium]
MKKILFFFAFCVMMVPAAAFAQYTFPLVEIQKLTGKNASDFETMMLEKDYSIQTKLSNPTTRVYWSDKPGAEGKKFSISRYQLPGAAVNITFTTTDKKYYLELKKTLASSGFKFLKEENKTTEGLPVVWYHYSNGVHTVSLTSYTKDVTWFMVQVHI